MLAAILLIGCKQEEPAQKMAIPISINLLAKDMPQASYAPAVRKIADPGTTEHFLFPHYLYVIIMKQNLDDSWSVWQVLQRTLSDEDWTATRYAGLLMNAGDSIYQYNDEIDLLLTNGTVTGRQEFRGQVYAVASAVPLSFNRTLDDTGITSMSDLLTLTFDASSATVQQNLQHIYASPYNYEVSGTYYGEFNSVYQKVPHVRMLLYHVAAKVDVKWNVDENNRINKANPASAVRLTSMKACNLFNGNAYCFKPMENVVGSAPLATGDTIEIIKRTDEGLWWEGRSYFYTIPYTTTAVGKENYFPLQMQMETNASGNYYRPTLYLEIDPTATFVPWLRADFNLNQPLSAGTDTKVVAKDS